MNVTKRFLLMAKKKNYHECLTTPLETGIRNFNNVAKFYLYYAPNLDTAQSKIKIESMGGEIIFDYMLKETGLKDKYKVLTKIQPTSWKKYELDNDIIDFEKSAVIMKKMKNESCLQALLRHIRNALAHGYIYVWKKKKGNYILFVDYDSAGANKKCTAKILVSMSILEKWKEIIEHQIGNI